MHVLQAHLLHSFDSLQRLTGGLGKAAWFTLRTVAAVAVLALVRAQGMRRSVCLKVGTKAAVGFSPVSWQYSDAVCVLLKNVSTG